MAEVVSTLIVREVNGLKRSVTLRGGGLPFQGAPWGGTQRNVTTWYPGNAQQATQHILGPTEKQSAWEGKWRTTQLVRAPVKFIDENGQSHDLSNAFTLMEVLEDMFRTGATLSVEWTDNNRDLGRRIVREGVAAEWDFKIDRGDDIAWTITWEWSGRGIQQQKVVAFRSDNMNASLRSAILAGNELVALTQISTAIASRRDVPNSATQFSLGQLENLANAPFQFTRSILRSVQQVTNRLKRIGDLINKVRSIPSQLTGQVLDTANNTVAISNQFIDTISRQPPEALANRSKVSLLTNSLSFYGSGIAQAQLLRRSAQGLRTQVQGQEKNKNTILAVHVVRGQGETLASISQKFYKTTEYAPSVARANLLPLNQIKVDRGTVLIIPTVETIKSFNPTNG